MTKIDRGCLAKIVFVTDYVFEVSALQETELGIIDRQANPFRRG